MRVELSPEAFEDLELIAWFIGLDSPLVADSFVARLRERCESLSDQPRRFPVVKRLGATELRKLSWRGYAIFYRIEPDCVLIICVIHGMRDWTSLFEVD